VTPPIAIEAGSRQMARCRSCDAVIEWAVTSPRGRRMPFNAPIVLTTTFDALAPVGVLYVDMDRTTSHFATCPDAARWRRNTAPRGARVR